MTTALDIITRAYRKAGIAAHDEPLTADQAIYGRDALNAMMHGWKLRGVDLEHVSLELADTFSLDPEFEEGTTFLLAGRISPDYQVPVSFDADDWFRTFQAAYTVIPEATIPRTLRRTPSQRLLYEGT